ncbi:MAG: DUF1349 domain-containing protein [candidate division KSB1 bacterium]
MSFRKLFFIALSCCALTAFLQIKTLKGWGEVIDPDGDCVVKLDKQKLLITVPGTLHDLNPRNGKINAPLVLQNVAGDFEVQVRVSGAFQPGKETTAPKSHAFNGAGLLLWQDEKNYLRLERNVWIGDDGKLTCFPPLLEQCQDGQYAILNGASTTDPFFQGRSTWLRLARRGEKIFASLSHDGKKWMRVNEFDFALARDLRVGVAAINTSDEPFAVKFDEFKIEKL